MQLQGGVEGMRFGVETGRQMCHTNALKCSISGAAVQAVAHSSHSEFQQVLQQPSSWGPSCQVPVRGGCDWMSVPLWSTECTSCKCMVHPLYSPSLPADACVPAMRCPLLSPGREKLQSVPSGGAVAAAPAAGGAAPAAGGAAPAAKKEEPSEEDEVRPLCCAVLCFALLYCAVGVEGPSGVVSNVQKRVSLLDSRCRSFTSGA
jgi:hypothetical protein